MPVMPVMRTAALGFGLAIAIVALAFATPGCSVHRKSDDLACNDTRDCKNGGSCDRGYCIGGVDNCPAPCTDCDLTDPTDLTCRIDCAGRSCGNMHCPPGFDCTFHCNSPGACGSIDCAAAKRCNIECSDSGACQQINCGPGECAVSCSGAGACPSIDCVSSCACDVSCGGNLTACPDMSCPTVFGTGDHCTRNGSPGARCDSNPSGCDTCSAF
jgi:hypothetical protein